MDGPSLVSVEFQQLGATGTFTYLDLIDRRQDPGLRV
jgi:hypothetical protein